MGRVFGRRGAVAALVCLAAAPLPPAAAGAVQPAAERESAALPPAQGYDLVGDLISDRERRRRRAAGRLIEAGDPTLVPAIVDGLFFVPTGDRGLLLNVLESLTGERRGRRYLDWVEYVGSRTDLEPKPGYAGWKGSLLARIDPRFGGLIHDGVASRIRLEEVVWGGVRFEGIPALDRPAHVPATEAGYLEDDEIVYGVAAGGEHRAYPRRILSWHEMTNDLVGGEPVTLSYCTLCGTAVLYSGRVETGEGTGAARTLTFGTSGLLYRSNKLMVDRTTGTLWSNVTGEAVIGPLAAVGPPGSAAPSLEPLPVTVTTWGEWRSRHPETTVLALDETRARRWGFDYSPGAADRARRGVSFPVWQKSGRLDPKAEVYALRLAGVPKAYPLETLADEGVVNDTVGGEAVVLVSDPASGAVRAYRRDGYVFRRSDDGALVDREGRSWTLTEAALEPSEPDLEPLPRLPGHNAFWFGWFGFYPETDVYD